MEGLLWLEIGVDHIIRTLADWIETSVGLRYGLYTDTDVVTHIALRKQEWAVHKGLFEMIVRVSTTCHTQYTWDSCICIVLFNRTTLQVCYIPYSCSICGPFVILQTSTRQSSSFQTVCSMSAVMVSFTHAPCLLKLCIPPSNGIVWWWFFTEFGAELPLDNCNWPKFMKCKHTKCNFTAVGRHLSELRSKRRNA